MKERRRGPWVLLLIAVGLMLTALVLLYVSTPPMTVLSVKVLDADTGDPLSGALVHARPQGEELLPAVTTDERGVASFSDAPPSPAYLIRVQKVDYDLTFETAVVVPAAEETEVTVALTPNAGGRLFVGLDGTKVVEIDTGSLLDVQTIRLPTWKQDPVHHLLLHPSEEILYTIAGDEGCVLDSRSGAVLKRFTVDGTVESLGLSDDGGRLLVTSRQEDNTVQLSTLDSRAGELLTSTTTFDPMTATQFIWQPGDSQTYLVEPFQRLLWVLDVPPEQILERIATAVHPEEGTLSADGRYLNTWSSEDYRDLQLAFLADLNTSSGRQSLPQDSAAWALSTTGQELYVLDPQLGTLSILDPMGQEPPTLVAVGKEPAALVVSSDDEWAYVANQSSRTVSAIYLPAATVVQTLPVSGEPFWLALREGGGREQ